MKTPFKAWQLGTNRELYSEEFQVEQKCVAVELLVNEGGAFLRISEKARQRMASVIIPAAGLPHLVNVLKRIAKTPGYAEHVR